MKVSDLERQLEGEGEADEWEEPDEDAFPDDSPIEDRLMESEGNLSEALILLEEVYLILESVKERGPSPLTIALRQEVVTTAATIEALLATYDIKPGEELE